MIAREGPSPERPTCSHLSSPSPDAGLERELGCTLFERVAKRRIELTEAGVRLRSRAEEIADLVDRTEQEFTARRRLREVRIGGGETPAMSLITISLPSCKAPTRS